MIHYQYLVTERLAQHTEILIQIAVPEVNPLLSQTFLPYLFATNDIGYDAKKVGEQRAGRYRELAVWLSALR